MKITGSIVKAAGERFALVAVQPNVLEWTSEADRYVEALGTAFEDLPVVLVSQTDEGKVKYYGREDLTEAMAEVPLEQIPWREIDADL
jgi:hypothetical protein